MLTSADPTTREATIEGLGKKLRPSHMGVIFRVVTNVIKNIQTFLLNQRETRLSYRSVGNRFVSGIL